MDFTSETAPADTSSAGTLGQIGMLVRNPKVRRAIAAYMAASAGYKTARAFLSNMEAKRTYTVKLRGDDDLYPQIHAWLLDQIEDESRGARGIELRTKAAASAEFATPDNGSVGKRPPPELTQLYASDTTQSVDLGDHTVKVKITKDDNISPEEKRDFAFLARYETIEFTAASLAGRDAVVALIRKLQLEKASQHRSPELYMATKWGDWNRRSDLPDRDLETVILRTGVREELIDDLERFLASEDLHAELGAPWHRGYLLHGPPGMGKTSMVRALATRFGLNLYYVPLGDMTKDTDLLNLVSRIGPRAVLLLEDVDAFHAAKSEAREEEGEGVSISGLLNALDGVSTPHGLITVLTTNNADVLDNAVIRTGRVDRTVLIDHLDYDQLQAIAVRFLGERIPDISPEIVNDGEMIATDVIEVIKTHRANPFTAVPALQTMIRTERASA